MIPYPLTLILQAIALLALCGSLPARAAVWWGWPISLLLVPTTVELRMPGGTPIDPRVVAALLAPGLIAAWMADPRVRRGWRVTDWLVVAVVLGQIISSALAGVNPIGTVLDPLIVFGLPYLLGRLALGSEAERRPLLNAILIVTAVLLAATLIEAATDVNLFAVLGTNRFRGERLGLARANGSMRHPLYLAMTFLMLMAPALTAAALARDGRGPAWWRLIPWLLPVGIVATVSRGPMLASLTAIGLFIILGSRVWRVPLLMLWAAGAALVVTDPVGLVAQFEAIGEAERAEKRDALGKEQTVTIIIDDQEYTYTSATHRALTFKVYQRPLAEMGLFGYGPGRRGVVIDESLMRRFWTIDNTYLSYTLAYGYLGMALLLGVIVSAIVEAGRILAGDRRDPRMAAARASVAVLLAALMALYGVSLNADYAPALMYVVGLTVNLAALRPTRVPAGRAGWWIQGAGRPPRAAAAVVRP
jgi:hypothetical protein